MPKYEMWGKEDPELATLDAFTQAYIEAAFWTSEEPGTTANPDCVDDSTSLHDPENENSLPGDVGFMDLSSESLADIIAECAEFQKANAADLAIAYTGVHSNGLAYDESSAGHDFWLTRNHHGAGFWDRATVNSPVEWSDAMDRLSDAAKAKGECDLYLGDDGKVYHM